MTSKKRQDTFDLLSAIRDGKTYTKASRRLSPLNAAGYVSLHYLNHRIIEASLTKTGRVWIDFYEKEIKKGKKA